MHDLEVQSRFVQMRSQGRSFARIAQELNVSKQTLINCNPYIRLREKAGREDPEHFGPRPWERLLRQIEEEKSHHRFDEAFRRVYGPDDSPPPVLAAR